MEEIEVKFVLRIEKIIDPKQEKWNKMITVMKKLKIKNKKDD